MISMTMSYILQVESSKLYLDKDAMFPGAPTTSPSPPPPSSSSSSSTPSPSGPPATPAPSTLPPTSTTSASNNSNMRTLSLVLRKKPSVRAQECVNALLGSNEDVGAKEKGIQLTRTSSGTLSLRDIVFQLRYALSDSHFAEYFIDIAGVAALLNILCLSSYGNH